MSLITYLSKKKEKKRKRSCNKPVKLHFYHSAQKYDDLIKQYLCFSKRGFAQKLNVVFT